MSDLSAEVYIGQLEARCSRFRAALEAQLERLELYGFAVDRAQAVRAIRQSLSVAPLSRPTPIDGRSHVERFLAHPRCESIERRRGEIKGSVGLRFRAAYSTDDPEDPVRWAEDDTAEAACAAALLVIG